MRCKSACQAPKLRLRLSVSFVCVRAFRALPAGVPWVYKHNRNTGQECFVHDKRSKLGEGPAIHPRMGLFAEPVPAADPLEIFQGNPASGALGTRNEIFGNAVIYILHKARFFSRPSF